MARFTWSRSTTTTSSTISTTSWLRALGLLALLFARAALGLQLNIQSEDSIRQDSADVAYQMMTYYSGNESGQAPGTLPMPYYWWEAGGMFMHMVDYWYYTGDTTYNAETVQAICWQAGSSGTFMPPNQTADEGNDDQVFWAYAAMDAAELNFEPPETGYPTWAAMGQAVFNLQAERWDPDNCNGGLRWQFTPLNRGYMYKNTVSNMGFFLLAARLARYTGNVTYVEWAEKEWNWYFDSGLFIDNRTTNWQIWDGAQIPCSPATVNHAQYSYNYGITLAALAYMYNHTEDAKWLPPIYGFLNTTLGIFFTKEKVCIEAECEPYAGGCGVDSLTFKSYTIRWLVVLAQLVPELYDTIWPYIAATGPAAAAQCDGGASGQVCGYHWSTSVYDGTSGVGQQMSALSAIMANMLPLADLKPPLSIATGAVSKGDPSAGTGTSTGGSGTAGDGVATQTITTGDKAGAGILTALALVFTLGGAYWIA